MTANLSSSTRLTQWMKRHKVTQIEMAKRTGYSNVTICRLMNGQTRFTYDLAVVLGKVMGVSWQRLMEPKQRAVKPAPTPMATTGGPNTVSKAP